MKIKKYFYQILAVGVGIAVFLLNYKTGTFLSGWDNLHPEFNFAINLKRTLFSSWQEYQGLGLLGGMGHASDLVRQIFLWLSSLVLPVNFIRYFFHFFMLLTGALGMYFLLKDFILEKSSEKTKKWGSLGGTIFYLFNLGTLQMFYLPFEVFSTHFGFLPWLFWGVFSYLKESSKKNLRVFVLINILAVSQGYVATIFVVYIMALCLALFFNYLSERKDFKKTLVVLFLTFAINAFWLLPNLYFVFNDVETNTGAKINLMSTEKNLTLNKKYGDFKDVLLLKSFWFDNVELQTSGKYDYVMGDWVNHLKKPWIKGVGYSLFLFSVLGIFLALKNKNKKAFLFLPVLLLGFTFLANAAFGFSFLADQLYKLPLFSQIFRFPFTKFSILVAFCLAVFYGEAVSFMFNKRKGFLGSLRLLGMTTMIVLPILFLFPVFQGKLFYPKEKVQIPNDYFEVFDFFKNQDKNSRIANFPQPSFWGWTNYKWEDQLYSGSGFLWYGIQQPILDRAFDVWSTQNENYYWEISYALYSKNKDLFEKVLEKYQINWLLVDGNVINPGSGKALFLEEIEEILNNEQRTMNNGMRKFELVKTFGKIKIYRVNLEKPVKDFVYLESDLPIVNGYEWGNYDKAYGDYGNYITNSKQISNSKIDAFYPFRSLFTNRKTDELEIEIEDLGDRLVFKAPLPEGLENYVIELPIDYEGKELAEIDPEIYATTYFIPFIDSDKKTLSVSFPKIKGLLSAEIDPVDQGIQAKNCNQFSQGEVKNEEEKTVLRLYAQDATNCGASFYLPNLSHQYAYLISAETKNISGKPLLFWLENLTNRKADIEVYLANPKSESRNPKSNELDAKRYELNANYLIQPPMAVDGLGYTLHFDNISIGKQGTINDLGSVSVYPIPYKFLTELKITQNLGLKTKNLNQITNAISVDHSNPSIYKIKIGQSVSKNTTLILAQAYHQGWIALDWENKKIIKDHFLINNWANGWRLNSNLNSEIPIILIFWPQYLEYTGFGILLFCYIAILLWTKKQDNKLTK